MQAGMNKPTPRTLRRYFLTGIVILTPLVVTIWACLWLFTLVDSILGDLIRPLLPFPIPGLGAILLVGLILLVGVVARMKYGTGLILWIDDKMTKIPVASWVYGTASQITHTTIHNQEKTFRRCVLIEYPRRGTWGVAFVTGPAPEVLRNATQHHDLVNVFVPTTPNPTSGFLILVPESDLVDLPIPVDTGFSLVISGGTIFHDSENGEQQKRSLREMILGG